MPGGFHQFLLRLKALFRKRRIDEELTEELEFHRALLREKLLREGVPPLELEPAARRIFGNPARWEERLRELWQLRLLENLLRDLRFSIRLLRKSPVFTAVALLTLALGVGANTAIFSLVNGLLLRPLPVPSSEQLAVLRIDLGGPQPQYYFPAPFFRSLEHEHQAFTDVFAFCHSELQVHGSAGNEEVEGQLVSGSFFPALQTPPLLGRTLTPEDDRRGGNPEGLAVVISEPFWQRWFNRAPDVIGRKLQIGNTIFTVAGVMPKRFIGADPTQRPEIYVPLSAEPIINPLNSRGEAGNHVWWLNVMARLRPGVSLDQANAVLEGASTPVVDEVIREVGSLAQADRKRFHFTAEPGGKGYAFIRSSFRKPLIAVFVMCGGIMLLACLNLAGLLLARGAARARELATRLAIGASRGRLIRQLMMDSLLLALLGASVGLAVAPLVSRSIAGLLLSGSQSSGLYLDTSLDIRVLGFAALSAVISAVLIGLIPAMQATARNLSEQIKEGQHAVHAGERRRLLPRVILASEVGLALVLLTGAGLLSASLVRLYKSGAGFDPRGVVNIALNMDEQPLRGDALVRLYQQLGDGLSRQPGVKSVSFAMLVPFTQFILQHVYSTQDGGIRRAVKTNTVAPSYFKTMRVPIFEGRDFRWQDTRSTGLKVILNQAAAKLLFAGQNPVGQHILCSAAVRSPVGITVKTTPCEVIGVVGDAKYEDLRSPAPATVYASLSQADDQTLSYYAVVRFEGSMAPFARAVRSLLARLAPGIPAPVMTTMDSVVDDSLATERVMALLSAFFAGCALLVTGIGLYGTLAYATARRTSEIGIRMALGAQRAQVMNLVLREDAWVAACGLLAGLLAALLASRSLAGFLYGTSARDPWVMILSVLTLGAVASAASLIPAIRASRIDPIIAIRYE